jgi:heat shock protein HtpX
MAIAKRVFLFLIINVCVLLTVSLVLNLLHIRPFLHHYGLDYSQLLIFCLVWGMCGAFISLALSRMMAKWILRVKVIDINTRDPDLRSLLSTVHSLAREAGLPNLPEVGIYESPEVNAFATGPSRRRALVAVSRGLLNRMQQKELEGVLAHEITHIANGDMVTMTLIQGIINAFVMFLARILAFAISGAGKGRGGSSSSTSSYLSYTLFVVLFEILFMLLGSLIIAWFSRLREFRADQGGAALAGKEKMVSALQSLLALQKARDPAAEKPSLEAMKISPHKKSGLFYLFATHPPLEKRIERLNLSQT